MPAPPRPRKSPPAASAESSAAISRCASEPVVASKASPIACHASDGKHVPLRSPAVPRHLSGAANAARDPSTAPTSRTRRGTRPAGTRPGRRAREARRAPPVARARREQFEPAVAIAPVSERLRRDRTDARAHPGHTGAGVESLRLHGTAELTGLRIARDDRVRHTLRLTRGRVAPCPSPSPRASSRRRRPAARNARRSSRSASSRLQSACSAS